MESEYFPEEEEVLFSGKGVVWAKGMLMICTKSVKNSRHWGQEPLADVCTQILQIESHQRRSLSNLIYSKDVTPLLLWFLTITMQFQVTIAIRGWGQRFFAWWWASHWRWEVDCNTLVQGDRSSQRGNWRVNIISWKRMKHFTSHEQSVSTIKPEKVYFLIADGNFCHRLAEELSSYV